jgi:outer membrane receptor protein involved in Fe transport
MSLTRIACVCVGAAMPMAAQCAQELPDLSLEALMSTEISRISGASRMDQLISEAPATVTVLTQKDIRRHAWRNLGELLRSAPGINISYNHLYSTASMRGMTGALDLGSYLLILVDGERMTSNVSDVSPLGPDMPIDMEWIDRVEVVTGASSAVYGANAVLAVVNIVTRDQAALGDVELSAAYGSDNARSLRFAGKKPLERGYVAASVSHTDGDGLYPDDDHEATRVFGRYARGPFTLTAWNVDHHKQYPYTLPPVLTEGHTDLNHTSVTLNWRDSLGQGLHANASLQYGRYEYIFAYGNPALKYRHYPTEGDWWSLDASLAHVVGEHTLLYGIEYMTSPDAHRYGTETTPLYVHPFDIDVSFTRRALYAQDIWRLKPETSLHLALRYEDDERFKDSLWVPRLGLVQRLSPATTFKLTYGESFRAHTPFEYGTLPDPLRNILPGEPPEQIKQTEIRLEHDLNPATRIEGSLYHIVAEHLVRYLSTLPPRVAIDQSSSLDGMEVAFAWRGQDGSRLRASANIQEGEFDDGGKLYNSPERMLKLNYSRPVPALDAFLGIETYYVGKRTSLTGTDASGYAETNLTLGSNRRAGHWHWQVGVYNLFDRQGYDVPPYGQHVQLIEREGRALRLQVGWDM